MAVLVVGIVFARLASHASGKILEALDRRASRLATTQATVLSPRIIRASRVFVFWLFILLAVSIALRVLGVGGVTGMLEAIIDFAPDLLVAFTIVIAGHLLGLIASHLLSRMSETISADSVGPRLLYGGIVAVAVVMALQHVGVDISFVTRLFLILVATISAGLMLTFALGARQHVANLLAHRELSRLTIGERIRVDKLEGDIVDVYSTGIDIATEEGIASIPAARIAESGLLRIGESDDSG